MPAGYYGRYRFAARALLRQLAGVLAQSPGSIRFAHCADRGGRENRTRSITATRGVRRPSIASNRARHRRRGEMPLTAVIARLDAGALLFCDARARVPAARRLDRRFALILRLNCISPD